MPQLELDGLIAHMPGVQASILEHAEVVKVKAEENLILVRSTTPFRKIDKAREHETKIGIERPLGTKYGDIDQSVYMEGEDPMALEFGHAASGYFNRVDFPMAKSPHGRYILTGAAGFANLTMVTSGMVRGKRGPVYGKR